MSCRLVVLSEIIAPYRIPVFNALSQMEGIDLHVVFLAETDPRLRQWRIYKDEIRFSYEVLPSWRRRFRQHNLLFNWGLASALRRAKPGAILCGGYNYPASWRAAWWARRNHVRFMVWVESTAHDLRSRRGSVESLKRRFLKSCDAFVVAGRSSLEYLKHYDIPEGVIFAAPNAVDAAFFTREAAIVRGRPDFYRRKLNLPSRFFLFVGRLVEEKGVFDLLAAYSQMTPDRRSQISLVLAGEGSAREALAQSAAHIKPGQVKFSGFVHREDLAAHYALAEALVFPTRSDPWGLVVNEAMTCGLPVIATHVAGCAADLVEDGWNGSLVPAGDVSRLTQAMEQLACSDSASAQMGERSSLRIQNYSPQACASGIVRATASLQECVA